MDWDAYSNRFEKEINNRSLLWDSVIQDWTINNTDLHPSEAVARKETALLTEICKLIENLIENRRNQITSRYIKDVSFKLFSRNFFNDHEVASCKESLFNFYARSKRSIGTKQTWIGFASFLDVVLGTHKEGNYLLDEFNDFRLNKLMAFEINEFIDSIRKVLILERFNLREPDAIAANLILFPNEFLIQLYGTLEKLNQNQKIDLLFRVRNRLNRSEPANLALLDANGRMVVTSRECYPLVQWINKTLIELTPSLFYLKFKSEMQRKQVGIMFENLVASDKLTIGSGKNIKDCIDLLVSSRFYKVGADRPKASPGGADINVAIGYNGRASELITTIYKLIRSFDAGNSPTDVQRWIYNFFHEIEEGFSLANIKKYCERHEYMFDKK